MKFQRTVCLALITFAEIVAAGAPLTSETASGTTAIDTKTVSAYKHAFSSLADKKRQRIPPGDDVQAECTPCWDCFFQCMLPPGGGSNKTFAEWPGKTTILRTATATPASPGLPQTLTATSQGTRRTLIVRATPTLDAQHISTDQTDQQKQSPQHDGTITDKVVNGELVDVTDTIYTFPLSGFHPATLPLVVSTPAFDEPVTLLAWANTTIFGSFISSSLVKDLDLEPEIQPISSKPNFLPEHDLTRLLGFETSALGSLSLDVLVGIEDRYVEEASFTVFEAPVIDGKQTEGKLKADVILGVDFLNRVQGIELTEEYSGSRKAGAKDGLPVLVQRVFLDKQNSPNGDSFRLEL